MRGELVIDALPGQEIQVADAGVSDDLLRCPDHFHLIIAACVDHDTDNGAALVPEPLVQDLQVRHLVDAGAAEGAPDIHHGEPVPAENIRGRDRISIQIGRLKGNGGTCSGLAGRFCRMVTMSCFIRSFRSFSGLRKIGSFPVSRVIGRGSCCPGGCPGLSLLTASPAGTGGQDADQ